MGSACCKGDAADASSPQQAASADPGQFNLAVTSQSTREAEPRGRGRPDIAWKPRWQAEAPMTQGQLLSKRDEFWDTAPAFEGRNEIWQALRAACEATDPMMAKIIIQAANIKLPNGNLTMAYDELGNKYEIPNYCLSPPTNFVSDAVGATAAPIEPTPIVVGGATTQLKLRLSTAEETVWRGPQESTIAHLKQFIFEQYQVAPDRQRFFYSGRMLTDAITVAAAGVQADSVVQVMVRPEDT